MAYTISNGENETGKQYSTTVIVESGGTIDNATINTNGYLNISSGGIATSPVVNAYGGLRISSGGTATKIIENGGYVYAENGATVTFLSNTFSNLKLNINRSATLHSGTTAVNTVVSSCAILYVSSGGTANNTILSGGTSDYFNSTSSCGMLHVSLGGTVNNTRINSGGLAYISSGGSANDTTVNFRGSMLVLSGGTANNTILNSDGIVQVRMGGKVNSTTLNSFGYLYVSYGGTADCTTVNSWGELNVLSGGTANRTVLTGSHLDNGDLRIERGGIANNVTISGGLLVVSGGGVANSIIFVYGSCIICSGGTATIVYNPWGRKVTASSGAIVKYLERDANVYYGGRAGLIDKANVMNSLDIKSGYSAIVYSNGAVNNTTINNSGYLLISQGGVANNNTVNSGGFLTITSGVASDNTVYAGGAILLSGGTANNTVANGSITVSSGLASNTTVNSGGLMSLGVGGKATDTTLNSGGSLFLSFGTATNTTINSGGCMVVNIGATAYTITVNSGGSAIVSTGSVQNATIRSGGFMTLGIGATASKTNVLSGAKLSISNAGMANSTTVFSGGSILVASGGQATLVFNPWQGTVVSANGASIVYLQQDAAVYYGGCNGIISKTNSLASWSVEAGNSAIVYSGGSVDMTAIDADGHMILSSGGKATNTTIKPNGRLVISSGGMADNTTVNADGVIIVSRGGKLTGQTTLFSGAIISALTGANVDFNLTKTPAGDVALFSDLSAIQGTPVYTITINDNIESGIYVLAEHAENFNITITVNNASDKKLGTLSVDDHYTDIDGVKYKLTNSDSRLSVIIDNTPPERPVASADVTDPTNGDVYVSATFSDSSVVKEYSLDEKTWKTYSEAIKFTSNGVVYFRGKNSAGKISDVTVYQVENIDKTAPATPTAHADVVTKTNGDVLVFAVFSNDTDIKEYSLDGETWVLYTEPVRFTSNGIVFFRGRDLAGNTSAMTEYRVANIEKAVPAKPAASANITEPTYGEVLVTAVFSSDSAVKEYSLDGKSWKPYTEPIKFTSNGTVFFRGSNSAGKSSDITIYQVTNIETALPEILTGEADNGWNDWLYEKKIRNTQVTGLTALVLREGMTEVLIDEAKTVSRNGKKNFVGFGESAEGEMKIDAADYTKIHLDCGTSLRFSLSATDAAKFIIYSLTPKKDKNGNIVSYTRKTLQTTTLTRPKKSTDDYMAESKALLLQSGDYYISMQSSNAKKGGGAFYNVKVSDLSKFYSDGDAGTNNWLYDKKLKVLNPDEKEFCSITLTDAINNIQLDKVALSFEDSFKNTYSNFVGFGDDTDIGMFKLNCNSARVSFNVQATNAAKIVIYQLKVKWKKNKPVYTLKALQSTKLKKINSDLYSVSTKALKLASGNYYIAVQSTNAKKGGGAYYNVSLNTKQSVFSESNESRLVLSPAESADAVSGMDGSNAMPGFGDYYSAAVGLSLSDESMEAGITAITGPASVWTDLSGIECARIPSTAGDAPADSLCVAIEPPGQQKTSEENRLGTNILASQ